MVDASPPPLLAFGRLAFGATLLDKRAVARSRTMEMELDVDTRQLPDYGRMLASRTVPTLTIMHHPKLRRVGERVALPALWQDAGEVEVSRLTPDFAPPNGRTGLPLASHFLSRKPVVIRARAVPAGMKSSTAAMGLLVDAAAVGDGVVRLDGVAVRGAVEVPLERLEDGVVVELGSQIVLLLHLTSVQDEPVSTPRLGLVGESDAIREVRESIMRAGRQAGPVLVRGETGTGKELVANAVHQASARREQPYVAVNMAAIPPTLAASELFGHARGAFSGAHQASPGMFGRAHGGTLFMDEIGDTPLDVQAALLRVMETGEVQQVGADRVKQVDVRVIAATDADLEAAITAGRFRAPLRYRLANLEILLPTLRARRDDIGRLLVHFVGLDLAATGRSEELDDQTPEGTSWIPAALGARLARYGWPGNVRQLRNVARWLAGLDHRARPIDLNDTALAALLVGEHAVAAVAVASPGGASDARPFDPAATARGDRVERRKSALALIGPEELERLMEAHEFKLGSVADALGVSRPALNDMVDAHPRLRRAQSLTLEELVLARAQCGNIDSMWRHLRVSEKSLKLRMSALGLLG